MLSLNHWHIWIHYWPGLHEAINLNVESTYKLLAMVKEVNGSPVLPCLFDLTVQVYPR